jgi:hypothetical protein
MTERKIVKIKNGWTVISSSEYEVSYRYSTKAKAQAQIDEWERREAQDHALKAEFRAARLARVKEYLAVRQQRRDEDAKQFCFDFN